jgi:hypothetical protein
MPHGEMRIARVDTYGKVLWTSHGADIFSEPIRLGPDGVVATDFEGRAYHFSYDTGK